VGLATIEIFGYSNPRTRDYAVELGLALQLTNILRDVGSDAVLGRIYLPLEDLGHFGVSEEALLAAAKGGAARPRGLDPLLAFEAERARDHYGRARILLPAEDRKPMVSAEVMGGIYRALLEKVVHERFPLDRRVSLPKARKAWIALRTVAGMVLA
jgi:phytoene synthase